MGMFVQKWGNPWDYCHGIYTGDSQVLFATNGAVLFLVSDKPEWWIAISFSETWSNSWPRQCPVADFLHRTIPGASLKLPWFVGLHVVCWWLEPIFSSAKSDIFQSLFGHKYQFQLVNQMAVMIQGSSFIVKILWLKHVKPWLLF